MSRPRPALLVAALAAVALFLAGCGADGAGDPSASSSAAPSSGAPSGAPSSDSPAPDPVPTGDVHAAPNPLPPGAPGDLVRTQPVTAQLLGAGSTTLVLHHSRSATGADEAVTGTVIVPTAPWTGPGPRPWVAYAPGSQGLGEQCAPSRRLVDGTEAEALSVSALLARGWGVAVTDYDGYTEGGKPSYVVGPAMAHALLDVSRAARAVPGSGITASTPWAVAGYSQGGAAAAWAASAQPQYAPDVHLVGAAAGGVPADLTAVGRALDGKPGAGLLFSALIGLGNAYLDIDLDGLLDDAGRAGAARLSQSCLGDAAFNAVGGVHVADVTSGHQSFAAVAARPEVARALAATNLMTAPPPKVPILQFHATSDELVPFAQASALHRSWCAKGVDTRLDTEPGGHSAGALRGGATAITWLGDAFAGRPLAGSCNP
ncbi:lipase family protein [Actinomycetospora endophytica]|uniref:Lipase family protein n=1 Tax=Actinomycetospora endophytica TaxID=2291215 RepID=A0ABS8P9B8_9PSEU|nr:lipase family protein [Actinomycetospora endophytica]MCD2194120.1 lipase family protein [Actinomycetospora endophytica]